MRLTELKGDAALDAIADLIDPIGNIISDKKIIDALKGGPDKLGAAVPLIVRKHKDDLVTILATYSGQKVKDYRENMTVKTLLKDTYTLLTDAELLDFLSLDEIQK